MKKLFCVVACMFLVGCGNPNMHDTMHTEIVRLFMHQPGHFSAIGKEKDGKTLKVYNLNYNQPERARVIADVPEGKAMWFSQNGTHVEIHIPNESCIEGGGFQNGKDYPSKTIPIK